MAKVIQAFRERFMNYKLFRVGDDYQNDDQTRVDYLVEQGFLKAEAEPDAEPDAEPVTLQVDGEKLADTPAPAKKRKAKNGDPDAG